MSDVGPRHVDLWVIESYLVGNVDGVIAVDGEPEGFVVIDPARGQLAIRLPAVGELPDVTGFENLSLDIVQDENRVWAELSVHVDNNVEEVYPILCNIMDRVQVGKESFSDAVAVVLNSLSELLAGRPGLSREQEVGLLGELLALRALSAATTPAEAIAAWRGPSGEEHDFGLNLCDVEVKTTLSERPSHWISSLTQLVPTQARPLFLLSIQLTSAGAGTGWSLPALVAAIRDLPESHVPLENALSRTGFRDRDVDMYASKWRLRHQPVFLRVEQGVPSNHSNQPRGVGPRS